MASHDSPESDVFHSLSEDGFDDGEDDAASDIMEPPVHPVAAMQAAFEESIIESTADDEQPRASLERDAEGRRQKLLNSQQFDHSLNSRWNQRKTAQYHPLLKLLAQIVFGMHLLQQEQAKSEEEVVKILQTHVNEVDAFLERTSEDFELAIKDIEERIKFLKLPMKHLDVFNVMLEETKFRTSLLDGNSKIEQIIHRTEEAKGAALMDIRTGVEANRELSRYLDSVQYQWPREKRAISDVYGAMRGNEQGWSGYLEDLQGKGKTLEDNLAKLSNVIGHMSKLAAAADRRSKARDGQGYGPQSGSKSAPNSPCLRSKFAPEPQPPMPSSPPARNSSFDKPLPRQPQATAGAQHDPKASGGQAAPFPNKFESRGENRYLESRRVPSASNGEPTRPKTADGPLRRKEARAANERERTDELAQFFKSGHSNPLRSNPPPSAQQNMPVRSPPEGRPVRTLSQPLVPDNAVELGQETAPSGRSISQSARDMQSNIRSTPLAMPAISENEKPATYQPSEAQSPPRRSAFARRMSKRMRHMQQDPSQQAPIGQLSIDRPSSPSPNAENTTSPPIDSAYASSNEKQQSPAFPARTASADARQPTKGFTLFPAPAPPNPPTFVIPSKKSGSSDDHRSVATSMSKGRSFGGMRRYFHLRKGSKLWSEE